MVQGHKNVCSNFYPFVFTFGDVEYKSVEHAYHHVRALSQNKIDLAEKILSAKHAGEAKRLSGGLDRSRLDTEEDERNMRKMLSAKVDQLPSFREALRASKSARLVHATTPSDKLWGAGLYSTDTKGAQKKTLPGENLHGVMLMEVRDSLKEEKDYEKVQVEVIEPTGCDYVVVCHNGEKPPSMRSGRSMQGASPGPRRSFAPVFRQTGQRDGSSSAHRCFHCGEQGHVRNDCRHKRYPFTCRGCGGPGHKQRNCNNRAIARPNDFPSRAYANAITNAYNYSFPPLMSDDQNPQTIAANNQGNVPPRRHYMEFRNSGRGQGF